MVSDTSTMFRYCFSFLYYFHSIMGLIPFGIEDQQRIRRSKSKRRWTLAIGCASTALVCFSFGSMLQGVSVSSSAYADFHLIQSLVLVEFFIRYSTIVLCFCQILSNEANLHKYIHRFISIVQSVWCSRSYIMITRMVFILIAKMLIVDIGLCTLFAINYGTRKHTKTYINGYRVVNIYVVMVGAQITNLILLLLLFGSYAYARINEQLDQTVHRILSFETDRYYWSRRKVLQQQICCDASDTIDRHCSLHQELTEIIHTLFSIFQLPLLLINLNQFIVIVSRARMPGIVLNRFINAPLDIRTERSIETFALAMLGTDFRMKVAGLYVLDLVFLFSLASTINMYLIVLIQFQLSTY
uniref:Gustatory receptor n=1 Tax=Anopheles culicifacies TaxID=139723 RepID=A0A182MCW3_9DIPT